MDGKPKRILAIGLDAFEIGLLDAFAGEGRFPNFDRLAAQSAFFLLNHDDRARFTGLGWEHFSTAKGPEDQKRWSAVTFDPADYSISQPQKPNPPFLAGSDIPTVVFDLPYFDLDAAPNARGVSSWGAHDPGTEARSRPDGLREEIDRRFGPYPAPEWIYGLSWPSPDKTRAAGEALRKGVGLRCDITRWLLEERLPDWQLAITVVSETHSAIEQLWHGADPDHPLNGIPSGPPARAALIAVYEAVDAFIGTMMDAFPDATLVVFSMHGMGANNSDLPAMFLLPELLYRRAFGKPYARDRTWPSKLPDGTPLFAKDDGWDKAMRRIVPWPDADQGPVARLRRLLGGRANLPASAKVGNIGWMPAARYSPFWPEMPAFAFPAYYDAWVRLNLAGRERSGLVAAEDYEAERDAICALLSECRDPVGGHAAVEAFSFPDKKPYEIGPTEADIYVTFAPNTTGLAHPELGTVGPVPYRRTGGHTGKWGALYAKGEDIAPGDRGTANAFDVAQTIIDLTGMRAEAGLSGQPLTARLFGTG
jgi:predicted AlkP superfamily phosphohydrolase/phosphomutase